LIVLVKRHWIRDFVRNRMNLQSDAERSQPIHVATVELRHGLRLEQEGFRPAFAGADDQPVIDEVEVHLEGVPSRDGRGAQPARQAEPEVNPLAARRQALLAALGGPRGDLPNLIQVRAFFRHRVLLDQTAVAAYTTDSASTLCTSWTQTEPSPTAAATRLTLL